MSDEKESILEGRGAFERYKEVKDRGLLLFECIVGSTAYGTNLPTSDVDKKFIYLETLENVLSNNASQQINITDDYVGYELGRYLGLLRTQNPNIIELVNSAEQHIEYCHPLFREIIIANKDKFLTKKVAFSFGEYARAQIKKAQGTNKKFMNPMERERKTIFDFCWTGYGQGSRSLRQWFEDRKVDERICGAVAIDHMKNCFHLFVSPDPSDPIYKGVIDKDGVNVKLSSVEKGLAPDVTFYCNIEGFSKYCRDYKEYWEWMEKRNEQRFVENAANEHNYDRKNMMHCHRLLDMCIEILKGEGVKVYRPNREELLGIRLGNSTYQELVDKAEEKYQIIQDLYNTTHLPEVCERSVMQEILLNFRLRFYNINTI